jgi:hypothetical protein
MKSVAQKATFFAHAGGDHTKECSIIIGSDVCSGSRERLCQFAALDQLGNPRKIRVHDTIFIHRGAD